MKPGTRWMTFAAALALGACGATSRVGSTASRASPRSTPSTTSSSSTSSGATSTTGTLGSSSSGSTGGTRATGTTGTRTSTSGSSASTASSTSSGGTTGAGCAPSGSANGATFVSQSVPSSVVAGSSFTAQFTFTNSGDTTWSQFASQGYYLGSQAPQDNFTWGTNRAFMDPGACIAPGQSYTFTAQLTAPATPGTYTLQWQVLQDGVQWFGALTPAVSVTVAAASPSTDCCGGACQAQGQQCASTTCGCVTVPADDLDLHSATLLNSPDVSGWPATAKITALSWDANGIHVEFTKQDGAERWPDYTPPGWTGPIQYTMWGFENINGQWYGSGVVQCWYGLASSGGPPSGLQANWFYDANRWGPLASRQPAVGEQFGFMVTAGNARNDGDTLVQERSNLVVIELPPDTGASWSY